MRWDDLIVPTILIALVAAFVFSGKLWAQDDDAEPTVVEFHCGALPNEGSYIVQATLPSADRVQEAVLAHLTGGTFCHAVYVSGPQAALWTASRTDPARDAGGCRDVSRRNARKGGFYSEGYSIWGASGLSCESYGVPLCTGPFCW